MFDSDSRQRCRHWRDSVETLVEIHPRSFGVSVDAFTWKVLPAALERYGIGSKNWPTYAMFICYDSDTNSQGDPQKQRCLSYDEKPLQLWIRLRNAGKHPAFVLKHIDDIKSPIAVIRQRQAERQATSTESYASDLDNAGSDVKDATDTAHSNVRGSPIPAESIIGASYAVAIFPYWAVAPDELDIKLDDAFIVLSRAEGWWMVQRDNSRSRTVNGYPGQRGWVPSGALLETSVSVATPTAEAMTARTLLTSSTKVSRPILPSCILSTSYPAAALRDYQTKGDGEANLVTGDSVKVYKGYNNWSYVVQDNGNRGWVPSWFLGKA